VSIFTASSEYPFSCSSNQDVFGFNFPSVDCRQGSYETDLNEEIDFFSMGAKLKTDLVRDSSFLEPSVFDFKKGIILPKNITLELALETGYSLGDGFISNKKYEYRLKGNKKDEQEFYESAVKPLYKKLFNLNIKLKNYETTVGFEEYSKAIWEFKVRVLGIKPGRKTDVCVPQILKKQGKEVLAALMQGLLDTDGNIYFKSQGKRKSYYPIVSIVTISKELANDIYEIFVKLGFKPYFWESKKLTSRVPNKRFLVRISGYKNFQLYKEIIGTRQPKNICKIKSWEEKNWN